MSFRSFYTFYRPMPTGVEAKKELSNPDIAFVGSSRTYFYYDAYFFKEHHLTILNAGIGSYYLIGCWDMARRLYPLHPKVMVFSFDVRGLNKGHYLWRSIVVMPISSLIRAYQYHIYSVKDVLYTLRASGFFSILNHIITGQHYNTYNNIKVSSVDCRLYSHENASLPDILRTQCKHVFGVFYSILVLMTY